MARKVVIASACRTAIGTMGGSLSTTPAADLGAIVIKEAVKRAGIKPEQIHYLYAPTHLNRTSDYGVSFERGTYIDYQDRRHVIISGTASINNKGQIEHPKDIIKQTRRMWENIAALLSEADCTYDEVGLMIVYLRDIADYDVVRRLYDERFPDKPCIIVNAPVCRSGWLVEMECIAVKKFNNSTLPAY